MKNMNVERWYWFLCTLVIWELFYAGWAEKCQTVKNLTLLTLGATAVLVLIIYLFTKNDKTN